MKLKKILFTSMAIMALGASTAMAAPINQMANNETAIGVGTKETYVEHKFAHKATVGFQYMDRDEYGDHKAAYMQYDVVGSEVKLIGGYRWDMGSNEKSNAYGGVALSTPKVLGFDLYSSYVAGRDFNEVQVGLNKDIIANVGLNVNYHNFKPKHGDRENAVGVGLTVKF